MFFHAKEISASQKPITLDIESCILSFQKQSAVLNKTQLTTIGEYIVYPINSILDVYKSSLDKAKENLEELIKAAECITKSEEKRIEYLRSFRKAIDPKTQSATSEESFVYLYLYTAIDFITGKNSRDIENIARLDAETKNDSSFALQMQQFVISMLQTAITLVDSTKIKAKAPILSHIPVSSTPKSPAKATKPKTTKVTKRSHAPTIFPKTKSSIFPPPKSSLKAMPTILPMLIKPASIKIGHKH